MTLFHRNIAIGAAEILCRIPLIFTVGYLARNVGSDVFGNWTLILTFQTFIVGFAGLGMSASLARFVPGSTEGQAFALLRYSFSRAGLCLLAIAPLTEILDTVLARGLGVRPDMAWLLSLAVIMAAGGIADSYLDAYFKALFAVKRQVVFVGMRTVVELTAVLCTFVLLRGYLHGPIESLAAYIGFIVLGKSTLYTMLLTLGAKRTQPVSADMLRQFSRYGLPMVPTVFVGLIAQSDRLVLSHFVSKADLGIYTFGATLAGYIVFLGYAIYPLLLPGASRMHDAGDTAGVRLLFQNSQRLFLLLWAGAMACLALWSTQIIMLTGGAEFKAAAKVLLILSFAVGLERLMGVYQFVFNLIKRTDLIFWLNLGYAIVMVASLGVAAFFLGIAAAPWTVLGAIAGFNLVRYQLAQRYLSIPVPASLLIQVTAIGAMTVALTASCGDLDIVPRAVLTVLILLPLASLMLSHRREVEASAAL